MNFCDFRGRATCDVSSGFCACKPGYCSSGGLFCDEKDTSGEAASLSQMDGEADTRRGALVAIIMAVSVAATILGVVASSVVLLKRRRQSDPLAAPLM